MEFFDIKRVEEARAIMLQHLTPQLEAEEVPLVSALGRVLAEEVRADADIPGFSRSTVDGYAVRARDTFGASDGLPAYLTVIGEIKMGEATSLSLRAGETARVATGGMLPAGADAVAMLEHVELLDERTIGVLKPVAPGQDIISQGEDLKAGELVLGPGRRLRPQDLGVLAGVGRTRVKVYRQLRVAVISTGDEVVPPEIVPGPGQVRDINSAALVGQLQAEGCSADYKGIVKDEAAALRQVLQASWDYDAIILSGGSSMGTRDVTAEVINSLGRPGVLVHGVAIRPGKPTVLAVADGKPIFGLPGHPVSAMIVFDVVVRPGIRYLMGLPPLERWRGRILARLTRNYASGGGREEYLRVVLQEKDGEVLAEPVLGKSGMISTMVKADGLVRIPLGKTGLREGEIVEVWPFPE